jgi:predicted RNase H-like nuclease (RuvC/YqgF family)
VSHTAEPNDLRWYCVNTIGMATLCRDEADARREAADADAMWPRHAPHVATQLVPMAEIDRLRARVEAADVEIADLHDRISDMRDDASKTEQTLRARVAEWEQKAANWIASPEATARLDGYRELAQRLNAADARVAELERDRVHAGVDICEVAAAVEVVRVMEIVKEVAGVVANLHEGPFRHGFEAACEEIEHRLRPCEHCDTALAKDGA